MVGVVVVSSVDRGILSRPLMESLGAEVPGSTAGAQHGQHGGGERCLGSICTSCALESQEGLWPVWVWEQESAEAFGPEAQSTAKATSLEKL